MYDFSDETEKLVSAQMINSGMRLYIDIFSHHGPFLHMVTHAYSTIISAADFTYARAMTLIFLTLATIGIVTTSLHATRYSRFIACNIFLLVMATLWLTNLQHLMLYHQVGGYLFAFALAQMLLPAILDTPINKIGAFISGGCITFACFMAYSFGLSAILFVVATLCAMDYQKQRLLCIASWFTAGVALSFSIVMLWLYKFGDITGYGIYHFYFNEKIYSEVINFSLSNIKGYLALNEGQDGGVRLFSLLLLGFGYIGTAFLICKKHTHKLLRKLIAATIALVAILYLNPRATTGFHDNGMTILSVALFALTIVQFGNHFKFKATAYFALYFCILLASCRFILSEIITKKDAIAYKVTFKPVDTILTNRIHELVSSEERILLLVFHPVIYIHANRLPASGHYFYLPWQHTYSQNPIKNYNIDICADITNNKPKVIWFDDIKVWGAYMMKDYAPCVTKLLEDDYVMHPEEKNIYLRQELLSSSY